MEKLRAGVALCGSYCTFKKAVDAFERLCGVYDVTPIMSESSAVTDTRFGKAQVFRERLTSASGRELHQREYLGFWEKLRSFDLTWDQVLLCTDRPQEAAEFFENEVSK